MQNFRDLSGFRGAASGLLAIAALVGLVRLAMMTPASAGRNDFAHYYVSSQALLAGENPYSVSLERRYAALGFEFDERIPHATNPPPLLWLFAPFAALPPLWACGLWQTLQLAALVLMLWLTWQLAGDRLGPLAMLVVAVAVLFCNPTYWHVYHSQVQMLLGAMLLGAFWLQRKERRGAACGLVLAAGMLKLFPLVLLPWFLWSTGEPLATRLKRGALVAVATVILVLASGPHLWSDFLHSGLTIVTSNAVNRTFNFGLPSLLGNLTYAWYDFAPPPSAVQWARRAGIVVGLAMIAAGYAVCFWGKQNRERQFALLSLVMLAGSATMWGHYLVMLVWPATVAALSVRRSASLLPRAVVAASVVMLLLAGTGAPTFTGSPIMNVLLHYLPLGAVLALAGVLSCDLLFAERGSARESSGSYPYAAATSPVSS